MFSMITEMGFLRCLDGRLVYMEGKFFLGRPTVEKSCSSRARRYEVMNEWQYEFWNDCTACVALMRRSRYDLDNLTGNLQATAVCERRNSDMLPSGCCLFDYVRSHQIAHVTSRSVINEFNRLFLLLVWEPRIFGTTRICTQ